MWFIFSISAAILWGITYVLDEKIFKHISISTALAIFCFFTSLTMVLYSVFTKNFKIDFNKIISSPKLLFLILCAIVTSTVAEFMIGSSIQAKNATLSSLIEISYPLFTILFSYLIYKEIRISLSVALGGILIFTGTFLIYYFNQ